MEIWISLLVPLWVYIGMKISMVWERNGQNILLLMIKMQ